MFVFVLVLVHVCVYDAEETSIVGKMEWYSWGKVSVNILVLVLFIEIIEEQNSGHVTSCLINRKLIRKRNNFLDSVWESQSHHHQKKKTEVFWETKVIGLESKSWIIWYPRDGTRRLKVTVIRFISYVILRRSGLFVQFWPSKSSGSVLSIIQYRPISYPLVLLAKT